MRIMFDRLPPLPTHWGMFQISAHRKKKKKKKKRRKICKTPPRLLSELARTDGVLWGGKRFLWPMEVPRARRSDQCQSRLRKGDQITTISDKHPARAHSS